jgi:GDP-L-fucose synthase
MNKTDKILVLGSRGMVGSAILRELLKSGFTNLLSPARTELDLLSQSSVEDYFKANSPTHIFLAAAKVGGIVANDTYRADFIFENLQIQQNVFNASFKNKTPRLLFLGSSCIYPKMAIQPLKEEYLLTASLESTNEPYAIAKIAGIKTIENFRRQYGFNWFSVMPTNLYGPNDNYDEKNSHVIPGLIARMANAKKNNVPEFKIWGTGKPRREFLYVDDLARACVFLMKAEGKMPNFLNVGTGIDIQISELASIIAKKIGYEGKLIFDEGKPDGTMRKLLDIDKISKLGWKPEVSLNEGLDLVIGPYLKSII